MGLTAGIGLLSVANGGRIVVSREKKWVETWNLEVE